MRRTVDWNMHRESIPFVLSKETTPVMVQRRKGQPTIGQADTQTRCRDTKALILISLLVSLFLGAVAHGLVLDHPHPPNESLSEKHVSTESLRLHAIPLLMEGLSGSSPDHRGFIRRLKAKVSDATHLSTPMLQG